ncbi:uncharacterized protein [Asterias amurensis]|uniref:uncharacterized protein n=1 Tax=Asterias amurensis TaxID=7602 RepID=UPI003AB8B245
MSAFKTFVRTLLVFGLVLIPSLNAENLLGDEEGKGLLMNKVRELLAELKQEETGRAISKDLVTGTIKDLNDKYALLIAENDAQGVVDMYSDEVIRIAGGQSNTGIDGLKAEYNNWITGVDRVEIKSKVVLPLDEYAEFIYEEKDVAMYGPSSTEPLISGMTFMVWESFGSTYKIAIEIYVPK